MRPIKYDDDELLKSLKEENHNALKYIYATYYPKTLSVLTKYGASQEDVKDIMQTTIIDVVRNIQRDRFRGDSKIETYFISIAKKKWYTWSKKNQKNTSVELPENLSEVEDELFELTTEEEVINEVFERLKPDCYRLLKMFYYDSLSMKVIAEKMNYSEGFVRVKKNRCMEGLKKRVFEHTLIQEKYPNASRSN